MLVFIWAGIDAEKTSRGDVILYKMTKNVHSFWSLLAAKLMTKSSGCFLASCAAKEIHKGKK